MNIDQKKTLNSSPSTGNLPVSGQQSPVIVATQPKKNFTENELELMLEDAVDKFMGKSREEQKAEEKKREDDRGEKNLIDILKEKTEERRQIYMREINKINPRYETDDIQIKQLPDQFFEKGLKSNIITHFFTALGLQDCTIGQNQKKIEGNEKDIEERVQQRLMGQNVSKFRIQEIRNKQKERSTQNELVYDALIDTIQSDEETLQQFTSHCNTMMQVKCTQKDYKLILMHQAFHSLLPAGALLAILAELTGITLNMHVLVGEKKFAYGENQEVNQIRIFRTPVTTPQPADDDKSKLNEMIDALTAKELILTTNFLVIRLKEQDQKQLLQTIANQHETHPQQQFIRLLMYDQFQKLTVYTQTKNQFTLMKLETLKNKKGDDYEKELFILKKQMRLKEQVMNLQ